MKKIVGLLIYSFILLIISSCDKETDDQEKLSLISPSDANSLTAAITIQGASRETGNPPSPTGSAAVLTPLVTTTTSSNGSSTPLTFSFGGESAPVGAYVQVVGATSYFDVPISNPTNATSGQISLPVGLPTNLDEGEFSLGYCVYDNSGNVSNVGNLDVNVLKLGTGALQISLSWNTETDQDLYVTDPSGTEIFYGNPFSSSGGELDRDNTTGFGPENIFWKENAPDGDYVISVNDYTGDGALTTCFVTISAPGRSRTFTITTQNGNTVQVSSFKKTGTTYNF